MIYFVCFLNFPPLPFLRVKKIFFPPSASVLFPKAFLGPHGFYSCSLVKQCWQGGATAGRQSHGGRRGLGRLKILLPALVSFWGGGWGQCCSPPVRVEVVCQAWAEGWGQMVFPPQCVGLGPTAQGGNGICPLSYGWGINQVRPGKAGAQRRGTHWGRIPCRTLYCG